MQKFIDKYDSKYKEFERKENYFKLEINKKKKELEKIQNELDNLKEKKKKLNRPSWIDEIIKPLAQEIANKLDKHYEILGPFGICCRVTLRFGDKEKLSAKDDFLKITILPDNLKEGKFSYETGETIDKFKKGTIGQVNGMNRVTKELPKDLNKIVKLLK